MINNKLDILESRSLTEQINMCNQNSLKIGMVTIN